MPRRMGALLRKGCRLGSGRSRSRGTPASGPRLHDSPRPDPIHERWRAGARESRGVVDEDPHLTVSLPVRSLRAPSFAKAGLRLGRRVYGKRSTKAAGDRMRMPRNGWRTKRSSSPLTMQCKRRLRSRRPPARGRPSCPCTPGPSPVSERKATCAPVRGGTRSGPRPGRSGRSSDGRRRRGVRGKAQSREEDRPAFARR